MLAVRGCPESLDLGCGVGRGLVQHQARRAGVVLLAVAAQAVGQEHLGVLGGEVRLAVVAGDLRWAAADDHAVAALVEYLRHAGLQGVVADAAVEGDADVTGGQVSGAADEPPRHAPGLVVQGGVEIPCPGGLILEAAFLIVGGPVGGVPGGAADELQGVAVPHRLSLELRPEILGDAGVAACPPAAAGLSLLGALGKLIGPCDEDHVASWFLVEDRQLLHVQVHGGPDGPGRVQGGEVLQRPVAEGAFQPGAEDERGAEPGAGIESREGHEQPPQAALLSRDRLTAPVKPAPQAVDGLRGADHAAADGAHSGAGGIGGPVAGDAVPGVDMAGAGAELQVWLVELGQVHSSSNSVQSSASSSDGATASGSVLHAASSMPRPVPKVTSCPNSRTRLPVPRRSSSRPRYAAHMRTWPRTAAFFSIRLIPDRRLPRTAIRPGRRGCSGSRGTSAQYQSPATLTNR